MNTLDLDTLRGRWAEQGRQIDQSLELDLAAVRKALTARTVSAFRRHSGWLAFGLVASLAVLALLVMFVIAHWGQWPWVLLALALLPLVASEAVVDVLEWRALRRLDFEAPVTMLNQRLDALQTRRLRQVKAILACSVLLWMPLVLVAFKGLFGADLLRVLHPSVLWINLAIGVAFVPLSLGVAAWISRRFGGSAGLRRFGEDAAGDSWAKARGELEAREDFERLAQDDAEAALRSREFPASLRPAWTRLRWRVLLGVLACAAGVIAIGIFNAAHGGQAQFIVPGVLLNLALVAQMAAGIQLRVSLAMKAGGVRAMRERFAGSLGLRRRFAVAGVIVLPLVLPALLQVLARLLSGLDLAALLGTWGTASVLALGAVGCLALLRSARNLGEAFAPRAVEAMSLGTLARGRVLLEQLRQADQPSE